MKILIADDEDYTREGLIETIPWEKYEIDEIMQAVNGAEALRIAKWFQPDIVLTDVRMPKMDGIEFASQVLAWNPESRIIFMSGYMEIEYLKSAIRLDAIDYIEKPIDLNVLHKALQKAVNEVKADRRNMEATQTRMEFSQQKLFGLITSKEADGKTLEKLASEAGFPLRQNYVCLILQIPGTEPEEKENTEAIKKTIQGSVSEAIGIYNHEKRQYEFVAAYYEREQYRLAPMYQKLLDTAPGSRLGTGVEVRDYRNIYNSYRTACMAINCAFYQDDKRLFEIDEGIMQRTVIDPGIYSEFLQVLSDRPEWFEKLFDQLRSRKYYHREQVYMLMTSLLTAIYKRYPQLYEVIEGIGQEEQIQIYVREANSLSEIGRLTQTLLEQLTQRQEERSGYSRIIRGVIEYIERHYQEEGLSIAQIAEQLHFSPAYLNVLFKQEMKVTLKQYLSNYRLERAKRMLEQDYDKITEVAVKCGYANANYFAKVFREATGMSPAEYRIMKGGS